LEATQHERDTQSKNFLAKQSKLDSRITDLESIQRDLEKLVQHLTSNLEGETKRREAAEQQMDGLGTRRRELESELAKQRQAEAQLRRQLEVTQTDLDTQRQNYLAEQTKLETKTKQSEELDKELASMRGKFQETSQHCQKLVEKVGNAEREKAELTDKLDTTCELVRQHETSIESLESRIRDWQTVAERLQSLLRSETTQREQEQTQVAALNRQTAELNELLAEKTAAQQRSQQSESELKECIQQQKEQLDAAKATSRSLEAELRRLRSTLVDMNIIQSSLCARVRELTSQHEACVERLQEVQQ